MASIERFSWAARGRSFRYAFAGLKLLVVQHNAWLHAALTLAAVAAGLVLGIDRMDWLGIVVAIALVWFAEAINTAIEHLCDVVSPGPSEAVHQAKDIAAGAVLICAVAAALIGALVFLPHVTRW